MNYFRFWLGRHLVHLGLLMFPEGRFKRDLYAALNAFGRKVLNEVESRQSIR